MPTKSVPALKTEAGPNTTPIQDLWITFADDEQYVSEYQSLPYLQFLNDQDPSNSGLFISSDNVEQCGFTPDATWTAHDAKFKNATVSGYRTLTPRLSIVRQTGLLAYDRATKDYLGPYTKEHYNRSIHVLN